VVEKKFHLAVGAVVKKFHLAVGAVLEEICDGD
jgi:hypothetical protein